jgi:hypothetical protein
MAHASAPASALDVARSALDPGERLVWAEWARPARLARERLPLALFGLLWTGALARALVAADTPPSGFVAVVGAAFVLLGLAALLAPGWAWLAARATVYAVTDRRLLILEGFPWRRARSFGPGDINLCERTERADGSGDLIFRSEREIERQDRGRTTWRTRRVGFLGIPEVRRVEAAVRALRERDTLRAVAAERPDAPR